jgi:hypothetical protein
MCAGTLVLNCSARNVAIEDQALFSSKRRLHFQENKSSWNEAKPTITVLAKIRRKLLLWFVYSAFE